MGVSKNNGTSKSSILIGLSIINHPFWGPTPIFGNIQKWSRHYTMPPKGFLLRHLCQGPTPLGRSEREQKFIQHACNTFPGPLVEDRDMFWEAFWKNTKDTKKKRPPQKRFKNALPLKIYAWMMIFFIRACDGEMDIFDVKNGAGCKWVLNQK